MCIFTYVKKLVLLIGFIIFSFACQAQVNGDSVFVFNATYTPLDGIEMQVAPGNKAVRGIRVYDLIGNEVARQELNGKQTVYFYTIDTSRLPGGLYFCAVYSDKGILETRKIFVTK
jgi:hypothetical protein